MAKTKKEIVISIQGTHADKNPSGLSIVKIGKKQLRKSRHGDFNWGFLGPGSALLAFAIIEEKNLDKKHFGKIHRAILDFPISKNFNRTLKLPK